MSQQQQQLQEGSFESAWDALAQRMKQSNQTAPLREWHAVLDVCVRDNETPDKPIWVLGVMRDLGLTPTAASYQRVLTLCKQRNDRASAFHLVQLMFTDKVLLGDVSLPPGMEQMLRKILPPEAFE
ncbi:unnamed protein product [Agarophyton chilense]